MPAKKRRTKATTAGRNKAEVTGPAVELVKATEDEWSAGRTRARHSRYAAFIAALTSQDDAGAFNATASVGAKGSARTVRSAVLAAARRAGVKVSTAVHDGQVLVRTTA